MVLVILLRQLEGNPLAVSWRCCFCALFWLIGVIILTRDLVFPNFEPVRGTNLGGCIEKNVKFYENENYDLCSLMHMNAIITLFH